MPTPTENCFVEKAHKPHPWVYSAAGSWAPFHCEGVKK